MNMCVAAIIAKKTFFQKRVCESLDECYLYHVKRQKSQVKYYSLATTYHKEGALKDALNTYEKALRIWINEPIHYQSLLSKVYNNMSLVYYEQSNYDKQIEYISKALEIQKKLRST